MPTATRLSLPPLVLPPLPQAAQAPSPPRGSALRHGPGISVAAGGTLGLLVLIALAVWALGPAGRAGRSGSGLVLVPSPSGGRAAGLTERAAIPADQIDRRLMTAGAVRGGEVEVSLAWNGLTDLDLEVRDPTGEITWAWRPRSSSGGVQDVDANSTFVTEEGSRLAEAGRNPGPQNVVPMPEWLPDMMDQVDELGGLPGLTSRGADGKAAPRFSRRPVEHIYYAAAPKGTYVVYAHCYSWREKARDPLPFTVLVKSRGQVFHQVSGTIGPANYIEDNVPPGEVCRFEVR